MSTATETREQPIDLQPFCDDHDGRFALSKPWRTGDKVIATDGRIMIEVDASVAPEIKEPAKGERVPMRYDDIFTSFDKVTEWKPCPPVPKCEACSGTEEIRGVCDCCKGCGYCECCCGNGHECGNCDGTGKQVVADCEECRVKIGGCLFRPTYVQKFASLPNVQIAQAPLDPERLFFIFTGGRGALMDTLR